jgi:hypothetical protein
LYSGTATTPTVTPVATLKSLHTFIDTQQLPTACPTMSQQLQPACSTITQLPRQLSLQLYSGTATTPTVTPVATLKSLHTFIDTQQLPTACPTMSQQLQPACSTIIQLSPNCHSSCNAKFISTTMPTVTPVVLCYCYCHCYCLCAQLHLQGTQPPPHLTIQHCHRK